MAQVQFEKVVEDVKALTPAEQQQLRAWLDTLCAPAPAPMTEEAFAYEMREAGLLREVKPPIPDFTPSHPDHLWRTEEQRTMGTVLALSAETYHQLTDLAQRQQRPVEEMLRLCLAAYEEALYQRAHAQMVADGVLVSLPAPPLLPGETEEDDDFEPVELPGKPLSEIILEDRR